MKWSLTPARNFAAMAAQWAALHARCAASPLLAADFIAPLITEFGSGHEWIASCEHEGRAVALAVVVAKGRSAWTTFQPPQAPIGLWLQDPAVETAALLATLLRALPGFPLIVSLTQCDPALQPRPANGGCVGTLDYIDTARITLGGGFDAYWQGRGKNLRANLKKQRAKLDKDAIAVRIEMTRAPQAMAAAVADYGRLESAGWKARAGTAVDGANAQGRYYRAMLEAFCARGAGCVYRYWFGEQLVAMDLCIEDERQVIVLKTTYDESVANNLSPTLLMREQACRQLFGEARFERLEFYGKVMEWHTRWTEEIRTLYHVNYYRWPLLARLHAAWRARTLKETHVPG